MAPVRPPHGAPSPPTAYHHHQPHRRCLIAGSDFCPRPRLCWTQELHDKFVEAVDELGGPNRAKPIAILNLMRVEGLTRLHLKSHLQKFRLGKTGRRLRRKDFAQGDYGQKKVDCRKLISGDSDGKPQPGVSSSTEAGASAAPSAVESIPMKP